MPALTETTKNIVSSPKVNKARSEAAINRFLSKHENYEFINGNFEKKSMPNAKHSGITGRLNSEIWFFLKTNKIGRVYPEADFQIGADIRIPDVAFISAERIPSAGEPQKFWDFAPDLAIEVISPTDFYQDVLNKIDDYFAAQVKQVWLINPKKNTSTVYFSPKKTKIFYKNDDLTCEEILPGFKLNLSEIFID